MGYVKEKYTKDYFLGSTDKETNEAYGAAGAESFKSGGIDRRYTRYLTFLNLKDNAVLDIGCGRGDVVHYCAKAGSKMVFGIDFSKDAINIAADFNAGYPNVKLIQMEATDIDFHEVFDIVFLLDVIEHIPDKEMQVVYRKIYSALKNNGLLILNTPFYKSSADKDSSDLVPATSGMHCNKQTKQNLNKDLIKNGFRKYSSDVWSKSDRFSLSVFLYAMSIFPQTLLWMLSDKIRHPIRTFRNLCKKVFRL